MAHIYDDDYNLRPGDNNVVIMSNLSSNETDSLESTECLDSGGVPKAQHLFVDEPVINIIFLAISGVFMFLTIIIFLEEVQFIIHHFDIKNRRVKTIWVLAVYPVFSVCAVLGLFVPRAGTLVDLVSNVYFSTCLFQFVKLMVNYIGGEERMYRELGDTEITLRGPPCCCCCVCLPTIPFSRRLFFRIEIVTFQVTFIRPFLHFIAAVLWANGSYTPGLISYDNGYVYIAVMNLISTFTAVYGLLLLQKALKPALESFHLGGKFLCLQSVLLLTVIPNIIINILVTKNFIPCSHYLPSKTRGERIYHAFVIFLMLPLALLGRGFYRRKDEGTWDDNIKNGLLKQRIALSTETKGCMTSMSELA